jgi:uncharacterized protein DUF29
MLAPMASLYDDDILLWSEQQAELLRRLARGERVNDALDFENLVDEVESAGRSEFQAVESLLDVALTHLLLVHGAVRAEPVAHWKAEALAALAKAARRVSPSMVGRLDLADIWSVARSVALAKLAAGGRPARPLPGAGPFAAAELLNRRPDVDTLLARLGAAAA